MSIRSVLNLKKIINVNGTMTYLGASRVSSEVVSAMADVLPHFVDIHDLQRKASLQIAQMTGAEAGFVTASCASGIALAVAATMTGDDLAAIEHLPDTHALKNEVLLLAGHAVSYGAPITQSIAITGARPLLVGQATHAMAYQLSGAITEKTACALYVVSHHAVQHGLLPLSEFAELCHAHGVPVIVDAASEYDLRRFLAQGADMVLYSAHKFLGGPTAGIVAGREALVRSAYLQNLGIGRAMKVGKEGMVGTIAALMAWAARDHKAVLSQELSALEHWQSVLSHRKGVITQIVDDPTGNPLKRLQVRLMPEEAGISAWDMADALSSGIPSVSVRDHELERGYFCLDPTCLHEGDAVQVAQRLAEILDAAALQAVPVSSLEVRRNRRLLALMRFPRL